MKLKTDILHQKCTYKAITFILISTVIIFSITIHTYNNDYHITSSITETYILNWTLTNDISCHQNTRGDALLLLSNDFKPPPKSIFIHETSCRGGLNSRQACAVESAARAHPNWVVHVLFGGPISKRVLEKSCLAKLLKSYNNVKLLRIHLKDYAKGTPVESFFADNPITKSTYRVEHTSDLLRYLTLYKYGGVYMDSDFIVLKSFDTLGSDWSARESSYAIDAGLMAFSRGPVGRKIAEASIQNFRKNYDPKAWGKNGPGVITRVVKEMCSKNNTHWIKGCDGFVIYDPVVFYPVYYTKNKLYFKANGNLTTSNETYAHHLWNALTRNYDVPTTSPYAKLAREYCPEVYALYGDRFGI